MRILTRYLLRLHWGPFLFALSALTGLLLVNTVAKRFEELAGKGLPLSVILEVFALSIPHIVALTLPMAVLVAVLYAFSQLSAENELTALKSSGVNLVRLLMPLLATGAVLAALMLWFNDRVLPETNHRLASLLVDVARKSPTLTFKEQVINEVQTSDMRTRYYLQAADIDTATNRMRDVVIYDLSAPSRSRTIYADSGIMRFNPERTDLFLTLYDGRVNEHSHDEPHTFREVLFREQYVRVAGIGNQLERSGGSSFRGDREMSLAVLKQAADSARRQVEEKRELATKVSRDAVMEALEGRDGGVAPSAGLNGGDWDYTPPSREVLEGLAPAGDGSANRPARPRPDRLTRRTLVELRQLQSEVRHNQKRMNSYLVEYHKKFSIPFACIVFVLIGAPLAVRFPRGGVGMVIAVSLTVFMIYYTFLIGGETLADRGYVSPIIAMWSPNLIFLGLGLWGLSRVGREVSTTRGGGWEDLFESMRAVVTRPFVRLRPRRAA